MLISSVFIMVYNGRMLIYLLLILQVKGCGEASCDSLFSAPIQGYVLGILSACMSALAGVYTEFLMKKNNDSLYWQNVQLYTQVSFYQTMPSLLRQALSLLMCQGRLRHLPFVITQKIWSRILDAVFCLYYVLQFSTSN